MANDTSKKLSAWMGSWTAKFKQPRSLKKENKWWVYVAGIALGMAIGFFFYRDVFFCLLLGALGAFVFPKEIKALIEERLQVQKAKEFSLLIDKTSTALAAGRSLENALLWIKLNDAGGKRDFVKIRESLLLLQHNIGAGLKVVNAFSDFAKTLSFMEANELAEVLLIANKTGGNLAEIFRNSGRLIRERMETEQELRLTLLRQQLEQKLLFVMPFVVLAMLMWMSPSYIAPLYETIVGRLVMTGALVMMVVSYLLSKKMSDIKI